MLRPNQYRDRFLFIYNRSPYSPDLNARLMWPSVFCAPSHHGSCTDAFCTMCDLLMCPQSPAPVYMICVPLSIQVDGPKHYSHLPNTLLVLHVLPNQLRPAKAWTLQGLWRCPVVSGSKMAYKFRGRALRTCCSSISSAEAWSNCDLGNVEARAKAGTLYHSSQTVPEHCVPEHTVLLSGNIAAIKRCSWFSSTF